MAKMDELQLFRGDTVLLKVSHNRFKTILIFMYLGLPSIALVYCYET